MKTMGVFLNSPSLGGAERSIVLQVLNAKNVVAVFYIPYLRDVSEAKSLEEYIKDYFPQGNICYYKYPKSLYSLSRTGSFVSLSNFFDCFLAFFGLLKLMFVLKNLNIISLDSWWINGNKAGLAILVFVQFFKFGGTLIYHLRDYPTLKVPYSFLWRLLSTKSPFKKIIISNSYDVDKVARNCIKDNEAVFEVSYNPVELKDFQKPENHSPKRIAVASMFVPWKGIHFVILFSKMYEKELKELGIEAIDIYGENIYLTEAGSSNYKKEILELSNGSELLCFKGNCRPEIIFASSDLLIHPSLRPEPFGRVIVEAFRSGVPVISTGLGGAGELIEHGVSGFKCVPNDYAGLFSLIKNLCNKKEYEMIVQGAKVQDQKIQKQQDLFWVKINQFL